MIKQEKTQSFRYIKYTVKEEEFRMIDEAIFKTDLIDKEVIGFQNQNSVIKDLKYPLFDVVKGIGSYLIVLKKEFTTVTFMVHI